MPLFVQRNLPAVDKLREEKIDIFEKDGGLPLTSDTGKAVLKLLILNIMPTKIVTETQLLRLIGQSGYDADICLLATATYSSRNTAEEHLSKFYHYFTDSGIYEAQFDGLIVTGAPVEKLEFGQVAYWEELCRIFEWAKTHTSSVYAICWGAQAALYYYYGIEKKQMPNKLFGIFAHKLQDSGHLLAEGLDTEFYAPHSRYTQVSRAEIKACSDLVILAESPEAGVHIVASKDSRLVCVTGHPEYDRETLSLEYFRDVQRGEEINYPVNYFQDGDPAKLPEVFWRSNGARLMKNWLGMLKNKKSCEKT